MSYSGGKGGAGVYHTIINQIPPHSRYAEPFLGAGSILRHKLPAAASFGMDADPGIIARWKRGEFGKVPNTFYSCEDGIRFLDTCNWGRTDFVYCDPPYLMSTRRDKDQLYLHELSTEAEHIRILTAINSLHCMVAISGYWSDLYAHYLAGWRVIKFMAMTRSGQQAEECLWMNYAEPIRLHDYRYLGNDYRDRERIRRKQDRWMKKLQLMGQQERYALLSTIKELWE